MPIKQFGSIKVVTEFKLNLVWNTVSTLRNVKTLCSQCQSSILIKSGVAR